MAASTNITPLSGEIMSDAGRPAGASPHGMDIVDAEFETVARPTRPNAARTDETQPTGLDILGRSKIIATSRRAGAGFWAGGSALAAAAFWMAGGYALVDHFPVVAEQDTVRVASLTTRITRTASGDHLVIDGELENSAAGMAPAPDLQIEVMALGGGITRYRLGNGRQPIEAGAALRFSSRLAAPAAGIKSVAVTVAAKEEN